MRLLLVALAAAVSLCAQNATVLRVLPSSSGIGEVRWYDSDASNYVGLKSPGTVSTNLLWSLPNADGAASECLVTNGSLSLSFAACAAGSTPPFVDSGALVKGSSDATKLLAFEVDGFTTATTRTVTVPNASFTMAGRNVDNSFSANQTFGAHILFDSPGVRNIGDATNYGGVLYVDSINAAPTGDTGNYVNTRKVNIVDKNGGTSFYDIQAQATTPVDNFVIRDKAGVEVLRLDRTVASAAVDRGIIDMSWLPLTDNARDLGGSGQDWKNVYFDGSLIHNGNTVLNSSRQWALSSLLFSSDGSQAIGAASANRPGAVHVSGAGGGVMVYNGSVLRMLVTPPYLSLYNNSSAEVIRLDSNSGDAIFTGAITVASCSGCGGGLPVTDTTGISKGSSDATKIVRFEVDGFTSGVTRVLTPPNADITIAGINLAQTWTATQTFGNISASTATVTSLLAGSGGSIDSSGVGDFTSLEIGSTAIVNSSRQWIGSLLFSTDGSVGIGSTSANRPANVYINGGGFYVYSGSTLRQSLDTSNFALRDGFSTIKYVIDSSNGNTTSSGYNSSASYQVSGTEVVSSGRVGKLVSLDINGTSNVIDSSRNASFANLTASGNLTWSGQTRGPYTADTGLSFASSAGKIAYYDTVGNFKGWIPVLP